jgi:hypothetical protein
MRVARHHQLRRARMPYQKKKKKEKEKTSKATDLRGMRN